MFLSFTLGRCEDESIDELAAFLGVGDEVAELTNRCSNTITCFPGLCSVPYLHKELGLLWYVV